MRRKRPLNDFGMEVHDFVGRHGISKKELAELAGVTYSTLVESSTGRCAGHDLIPKVRKYMAGCQQSGEENRNV